MSNNKNIHLIELGEIPAEYGEDDRDTICDEDPIEIDNEDIINNEDPIEIIDKFNDIVKVIKVKID